MNQYIDLMFKAVGAIILGVVICIKLHRLSNQITLFRKENFYSSLPHSDIVRT